METTGEIRLSFSYMLDEWKRIVRFHDSRSKRSWAERVYALILFALGAYDLLLSVWLFQAYFVAGSLLFDAVRNLAWALCLLALAAIIWFDLVKMFRRWRHFRKLAAETSKSYEFTFSKASAAYRLTSDQTTREVKVSWDVFSKLLENEEAFLLEFSDGGIWAIPQRTFASNEDVETFRQWAQAGTQKQTSDPR